MHNLVPRKPLHRSPLLATLALVLSLLTLPLQADPANAVAPININTATVEQLTALDGIGPAKAQAIVSYRNDHGPFQSTEDLTKVRGIGNQTLAKNSPRLTVDRPATP